MNKNQLKITFLGTGNALENDSGNFHSNLVVQSGTSTLFIDCGSDFPHALTAAGMRYKEVENLYISHVHADHAGGLEWLGFSTRFDKTAAKPKLYLPGIKDDLKKMLSIPMKASADMRSQGLGAYFNVVEVSDGKPFFVGDLRCTPVKTKHVDTYDFMFSHGLIIVAAGKMALLTSDTMFPSPALQKWYGKADLILHDCSTGEKPYPPHPHISQLAALPADIKSKMILYHYGPGERPNEKGLGFKGYAQARIPIYV